MSHAEKSDVPDVLIIGGGIIGCAAGLTLAERGLRVTIADRGPLGREASWAGAGILSPGNYLRKGPMSQLVRASVARYEQWTAQLFDQTRLDPQYMRCGRLELLFDEQQERMAASQCRAVQGRRTEDGQPLLERLDPAQVREWEPAVTEDLRGALRCAVTAQVRNPRLLQALRLACVQSGLSIREGVGICGLVWAKDRVVGVHTESGDLHAATTVLAAGAWSSQIDDRIGPMIPVYPVRGQILLLEHLPYPFSSIIERGKCYLACRRDGKILVGATEEHESGFDKRTTAEGVAHLLSAATRMVPALASATFLKSWAGLRPGTPDRRPYIGRVPGVDGLLVATGHFRTGLTLAPITAQILADLICEGTTSWDLSACQPGRVGSAEAAN